MKNLSKHISESFQVNEGKIPVGTKFNHKGLTYIVKSGDGSQSKCEVTTKSNEGETATIDNKIISKSMNESVNEGDKSQLQTDSKKLIKFGEANGIQGGNGWSDGYVRISGDGRPSSVTASKPKQSDGVDWSKTGVLHDLTPGKIGDDVIVAIDGEDYICFFEPKNWKPEMTNGIEIMTMKYIK